MTIRTTLAAMSRVARNRKLDDDQARTIKARFDAGEPIQDIHRDYPRVSRTTLHRIKCGERRAR